MFTNIKVIHVINMVVGLFPAEGHQAIVDEECF